VRKNILRDIESAIKSIPLNLFSSNHTFLFSLWVLISNWEEGTVTMIIVMPSTHLKNRLLSLKVGYFR